MGSGGGKRAILWFRNDLRLHDNVIVAEAARRVQAGSVAEVRSMLPSCNGTSSCFLVSSACCAQPTPPPSQATRNPHQGACPG